MIHSNRHTYVKKNVFLNSKIYRNFFAYLLEENALLHAQLVSNSQQRKSLYSQRKRLKERLEKETILRFDMI